MQVIKANEISRKYYYCRDNFHHYSSYPHIHTFTSPESIHTNSLQTVHGIYNEEPNVHCMYIVCTFLPKNVLYV